MNRCYNTSVVRGVLSGSRQMTIGVPNGILVGVFNDFIHEDPDGMAAAVLLLFGGDVAQLDDPVKR